MTLVRALLPYALASAAVVAGSATLVLSGTGASPAPLLTSAPAPATRSSPGATLPADARLAYWRAAGDGTWQLWASDVEGTRRWVVASEPSAATASLTRWRPDGEAVSYVRDRRTVVVAPLVGSPIVLPMSSDLAAARRVIVGYHWSPEGDRIALSMRGGPPGARTMDVWTVQVSTGLWRRATQMGEALAGPWVDEDEHLIETTSGSLFVAKLGERIEVRPISGLSGVSPHIGPDGRLYVAGGGSVILSGSRPFAAGGIWSMALDGSDVRRELADGPSEFRLAGRWLDGRWLIERDGTIDLAGLERRLLPLAAGPIAEVALLHERALVAISDSRVLLLDPVALMSEDTGPSAGVTLLVGSIHDAEVWLPRAEVTPPRPTGASDAPLSAFVRGNTLWLAEGSETRALLHADGGVIGAPAWSPDGAMIAVPVYGPDGASGAVVVVDRSGDVVRRFETPGRPLWSPAGDRIAIEAPGGSDALDVVALDESVPALRLEGYDATWTDAGLIAITHADATRRVHRVERWVGKERLTILDEASLAADPRLEGIGPAGARLAIGALSASADGQYVAVSARRCCAETSEALVVARLSDGAVVTVIRGWSEIDDPVRWQPAGHLFGRTVLPFPASNADDLARSSPPLALVVNARTGDVVAQAPGAFAGWSGDGGSWYAARPEGLFAHDLDDGDGALVSPFGIPFSVAPN